MNISPAEVETVARALLGEPNRHLSSKDELRFGNNGSVSVELNGGKAGAWYDHEVKSGGGLLDLIRREKGCSIGEAFAWLENEFGIKDESNGAKYRVTGTWVYRDRGGRPVFRSVRRDCEGGGPKKVHQERYVAATGRFVGGKGCMQGVRLVPYRLPDWVDEDAPIMIPEGEKHCDKLFELGYLATCNPAGGGNFSRGFAPYFQDRHVVLLPDNDEAGRDHVRKVATILEPVAASIRILELPDLGPKGDIVNWLEAGGTRERLQELIDGAPAAEDVIAGWQPGQPQAASGWPVPDLSVLSAHRLEAPALPLEAFGTYWADWIRDQAEAKSCAPDYVAAGLLASAGALIGNARWGSPWESWAEPPILWIACVGNPSSGKSPGLDAPLNLVCSIESDASENYPARIDEWRTDVTLANIKRELWEAECKAALKKRLPTPNKPDGAEAPDRPSRRRIVSNDPTIEKVARLVLANPKGLLLFRDELAGWIGALDKYGGAGSDRAFYLEAYGGRRYAVDRVKDSEPVVIPALAVSIAGGIQPDRLNTLVLCGDDDGLAARFLYLWPERVPPRRPRRWPPSGAKAKLTLLYALHERCSEEGRRETLRFSEAAAAAVQAYREQVAEIETSASGLFLSWLGKLPGMAVRLATVLEYLYWCGDREGGSEPSLISERAAVAAIAFLDSYAMPMARRCFGEASLPQTDRDAVALARWIAAQESLPDTVNARGLRHSAVLSTKEPERYGDALSELGEAGWARAAPTRSGGSAGRQRKDWAINPRLKELLS
jgi:hypothetical protein